MGRFIHTFACGEVGLAGTRRVLDGGKIAIGGTRGAKHMTDRRIWHDPLLIPYVGRIVYFQDCDDLKNRLHVSEVTFEVGKPGTRGAGRNRSITGQFICMARLVTQDAT